VWLQKHNEHGCKGLTMHGEAPCHGEMGLTVHGDAPFRAVKGLTVHGDAPYNGEGFNERVNAKCCYGWGLAEYAKRKSKVKTIPIRKRKKT
jgi:hypothetical protein